MERKYAKDVPLGKKFKGGNGNVMKRISPPFRCVDNTPFNGMLLIRVENITKNKKHSTLAYNRVTIL